MLLGDCEKRGRKKKRKEGSEKERRKKERNIEKQRKKDRGVNMKRETNVVKICVHSSTIHSQKMHNFCCLHLKGRRTERGRYKMFAIGWMSTNWRQS